MSVLPPREGLLIEALAAKSAINSGSGGRISTRLSSTFPAVRVTLLGGPGRLVENTGQSEFQVEVWGKGGAPEDEIETGDLASLIESEAMKLAGTYSLGTIKGSYSFGDMLHSPDPTTGRERFLLTIGLLIQ